MTGFDIWNELGNIYFKVGAFDEAIDAYNKAIELDFRIGWLYSNLGFAYVRKGKFADAIPMYEKSIELLTNDEDKAVSWSRLGEVYQQLKQYEQAVQAYQKAVELAPQDVSFGAGLSAARKQIGQSDQEVAVEETNVPVVAEPEVPEESSAPEDVVLADIEQEEVIIPEVVLSVDDSLEAENTPPGEEPLEGTAAPTLELENETVEAAAAEETNPAPEMTNDPVVEPDPQEDENSERPAVTVVLEQDEIKITIVNSLLTSGIELWRKGDHEHAREILQDALEAAGKAQNKWLEALSHNALALVKTELGKLEEAIASYTQAMQLAPEKIIPWNNIGHLYSKLDRNDEGMTAFLKAIEHNPEDFVSWDGLGDIYAKSGRLNDAIAAYQLGNVFGRQRRPEDVLTAFQMIIEPETESVVEEPAYTAWVPEVPETIVVDANEEAVLAGEAVITEESPLETIAADIGEMVEIPAEVLSTDEAPLETSAELPQPLDESPVVDEVSSIMEDVEADEAVLVAETFNEEPLPAAFEAVEEVISSEDVSTTDESAEFDDADMLEEDFEEPFLTISEMLDEAVAVTPVDIAQPEAELAQSENTAAVSETVDELAVPESVVLLAADTDQVEDVVADDQASEEMPVEIPEMTEEVPVVEDEPAVSAEAVAVLAADTDQVEDAVADDQVSEEMPVEILEMTDETLVVEDEPAVSAEADPESLIPVEDEEAVEELLDSASSSLELSRLTSAIAAYKKVTEINPENDRAWDSLGNLYRASERYDDAVSAFEQAISLRPNKEVYHYHLGLVYASEKRYEDAIGAFQKVIELNPEYTFAHCALAGYYRKLGKDVEAQEHIDKALPKMTSEKEYDRACFAAICGNTDEAIELLKIALEKKQTSLDWVRRDPDLDFIRDDRRFKSLVSQNGSWSERLSDVFSKQLAWSQNK